MLVVDEVHAGLADRRQAAARRHPDARERQAGDRRSSRSTRCSTTSVGKTSSSNVERGGEELARTLAVQDLHAITPAEYLEFGDAVVHTLSYQMARHLNAPVQGVYVANPGLLARRGRRAARRRRHQHRRQAGRERSPISSRSSALRRGRPRDAALLHARRSEGHADARRSRRPRAGSRRVTASATTRPASGRARTCREPGGDRAGAARAHDFRARATKRGASRAVARARDLRHAVLGRRRHRAQLPRHRRRRRRRSAGWSSSIATPCRSRSVTCV